MSNTSIKHDPESWKKASQAYSDAAGKMAALKGKVNSTGKSGLGGPAQVDAALQQVMPNVPTNIDKCVEGLSCGLKSDSMAMTKTLKTYRDTEEGQIGIVAGKMFKAGREIAANGVGGLLKNPELINSGKQMIETAVKGKL